MNNDFFKATALYKELVLLNIIEVDSNVTQRKISKSMEISVSMVNYYLDSCEEKGYIKRSYITSKNVKYLITKRGLLRKKVLNFEFISSIQRMFYLARNDVVQLLERVNELGFKKLILYGAGEVAEVFLHVLSFESRYTRIEIVSIIDDDFKKHGKELYGKKIVPLSMLSYIKHDAVLISSYTNNDLIFKRLQECKYPEAQTLQFFNL